MKEMILLNMDMNDFREILKEVLREELRKIFMEQHDLELDNVLLSRKEAAEMLKVSLVTINAYQKEGRLPYYRMGRRVYFKRNEILKALEIPVKYQRWNRRY